MCMHWCTWLYQWQLVSMMTVGIYDCKGLRYCVQPWRWQCSNVYMFSTHSILYHVHTIIQLPIPVILSATCPTNITAPNSTAQTIQYHDSTVYLKMSVYVCNLHICNMAKLHPLPWAFFTNTEEVYWILLTSDYAWPVATSHPSYTGMSPWPWMYS